MPSWTEQAACLGSKPEVKWHWDHAPTRPANYMPALMICATCPVVYQCRQDMVDTGEHYPNQIRGDIRMWTDDIDRLPDPTRAAYVPPKRKPGRPSGPLPGARSKDAPKYVPADPFNPHTRNRHNTPMKDTPPSHQTRPQRDDPPKDNLCYST